MLSSKTRASVVVVPLLAGLVGLMNLMQKPRFMNFPNVDVLQLLASGMCFGLALSALLTWLRAPRTPGA